MSRSKGRGTGSGSNRLPMASPNVGGMAVSIIGYPARIA